MALFNMIGSMFQVPESRTRNSSVYYTPKQSLKSRTPKGKLSKADIGTPSNFKHLAHMGFTTAASLDAGSDVDLKRLFTLAGIRQEHLKDWELSRKIFEVIEQKGGMEAVRKETLKRTCAEMPSTRYRLRSWSSSHLTPSKRQNHTAVPSPHAAKIPATCLPSAPFSYMPTLSKVPPPMATPPPFSLFPCRSPLPSPPPYLREFSPSPIFIPSQDNKACESIASNKNPLTDDMPENTPLLTWTPTTPINKQILGRSCSPPTNLGQTETSLPYQVPQPASSPSVDPTVVTVPPPPPLPPLKKCCPRGDSSSALSPDFLCNDATIPPITQLRRAQSSEMTNGCKIISNKETGQQNLPTFLDQIKLGVHLKSVSQTLKEESSGCSDLVSALMDVIQRRNKALHSSDDETDDDEWDD